MGVVLSKSTARVLPRLDTLSPAFSTFAARNAATLSGKTQCLHVTTRCALLVLMQQRKLKCRTEVYG